MNTMSVVLVINLAIIVAILVGLFLGQPLALLAMLFLREIPVMQDPEAAMQALQAMGYQIEGEPSDPDETVAWATDHKAGFLAKIN